MNWQTIVKRNNLAVSVVSSSSLNEDLRFDAEYYQPEFLLIQDALLRKKAEPFGQFVKSVHCGPFGSTILSNSYVENGVFLARPFNLRGSLINDGRVYIEPSVVNEKRLLKFSNGDIFFSRVGEVASSIVWGFKPDEIITISPNIIAVKTNSGRLSPFYASIFFETKYGKGQMLRAQKVVAQPTISTELVKEVLILVPTKTLEVKIEKVYKNYFNLVEQSKQFYKEAEQLLLKEINLEGYVGTEENISIRNFKDCITENRFDAEYWQPKYDEIVKRVSSIPQKDLSEIVSVKKGIETGSEAYSEEGKLFIRVSDFSIYGIDEGEKRISEELFEKLEENYRPHSGEVLFTKDGTIGISFALHEDVDAIVSSAFLRLKPKAKINNDYLALALNSSYCKSQIERMSGGAIIAHLKSDSAMKIKIPMLSEKKQDELANKVLEALRLRTEAKTLLEKAKRAVEIFVEKDEKEALKFLSS